MFFIFFLLAFFILILARLSANYTNTIKCNVTLKNVPDRMIVLNDSINSLNITMTTHGFGWLKYYTKTPTIAIDFKNEVKKDDSLYVWSLARGFAGVNEQFSKNINIKTINPDSLLFKVEINAVKMLPVKPNLSINYSPGYNVLNTIKTIPDSVKVIGPESLLNKLSVIETNLLEKSNLNKPYNTTLDLKLETLNSQITVKPKAVNVIIATEKFTEGTFNLPLSIINVPKKVKINYFPKTINLSFYTSLKNYSTINLNDFEVICDFNEHDSSSTYLTPKLIKYPKSVKTTRLHQQKIEYIISE